MPARAPPSSWTLPKLYEPPLSVSVAEPLAFPPGYGKQDFLIGAPLLPEALSGLPSAARRAAVLGALNGFDGRWRTEAPVGDPDFGSAVAAWQQILATAEQPPTPA